MLSQSHFIFSFARFFKCFLLLLQVMSGQSEVKESLCEPHLGAFKRLAIKYMLLKERETLVVVM